MLTGYQKEHVLGTEILLNYLFSFTYPDVGGVCELLRKREKAGLGNGNFARA